MTQTLSNIYDIRNGEYCLYNSILVQKISNGTQIYFIDVINGFEIANNAINVVPLNCYLIQKILGEFEFTRYHPSDLQQLPILNLGSDPKAQKANGAIFPLVRIVNDPMWALVYNNGDFNGRVSNRRIQSLSYSKELIEQEKQLMPEIMDGPFWTIEQFHGRMENFK